MLRISEIQHFRFFSESVYGIFRTVLPYSRSSGILCDFVCYTTYVVYVLHMHFIFAAGRSIWLRRRCQQTGTNENNSSNSESIEKMDKYSSMVQKLLSLSIKLVAVDFDKTIINIHTRGSWQFTSKSLVSRVRPSFKQFFTAVLNTNGLHVAVVTHSSQIPLIREVLEQALPDCDTSRIHYRGKDGNWKEVKGVTKEGIAFFCTYMYRL